MDRRTLSRSAERDDAEEKPRSFWEISAAIGTSVVKHDDASGSSITRQPLDPKESELRCRGRFHSFTSSVTKEQSRETWTMDEALQFIDSDSSKPFFAWIAFERPHSPHSVDSATDESLKWKNIPVDWDGLKRFEETRIQTRPGCEAFWTAQNYSEVEFQIASARYFTLIEHIDEQIGRLLAHLNAQGTREESLIFFVPTMETLPGSSGKSERTCPVMTACCVFL